MNADRTWLVYHAVSAVIDRRYRIPSELSVIPWDQEF
jgi:hypothetical protein